MRKIALTITALAVALIGCRGPKKAAQTAAEPLSAEEKALIMDSDSVMRVLTIYDQEDSLVLRTECRDFSDEDLQSPEFSTLAAKMVRTVTDPSQDGVGIAGPQVGLTRRIIAVQRLDKEGEPFEVYANARLDSLWGEMTHGPEGCLSIPGKRGLVPRYPHIIISYRKAAAASDQPVCETVRERVDGYTAIIFQHEIDHLGGILYTDKADTVMVDNR